MIDCYEDTVQRTGIDPTEAMLEFDATLGVYEDRISTTHCAPVYPVVRDQQTPSWLDRPSGWEHPYGR